MAAILLYHAVADDVVDDMLQVRPATIDRHLRWCRDLGYEVAPLADALAFSAENLVAITFDDGLASIERTLANLVAPTVFICPGLLGRENVWRSAGRARERLLNVDDIARLRRKGVQFGCHGWDHRAFVNRNRDDIAGDLSACRGWFGTDQPCYFAWPFGRFDEVAVEAVGREFHYSLAIEPAWGDEPSRLAVPRIAALESLTLDSFKDALELASFTFEPGAICPERFSPLDAPPA